MKQLYTEFSFGTGEVILCTGAIGSPQLLLLSGIGPRPYLSSWGIPVVRHSPYVGNYMYDNPHNGISIISSVLLEQSLIQVVGITDSGAYVEAASNVLPFSSPAYSAYSVSSDRLLLPYMLLLVASWRRLSDRTLLGLFDWRPQM
ncbi:hypothetical protein L1887_14295 [Cichorium endivia]|nr:hypothetical protein L1887_14295 [Cichorium endivia]